jgi:hypothetical protein
MQWFAIDGPTYSCNRSVTQERLVTNLCRCQPSQKEEAIQIVNSFAFNPIMKFLVKDAGIDPSLVGQLPFCFL